MDKLLGFVGLSRKAGKKAFVVEELESFLYVGQTDKVLIELTSRCNLKCPFCTVSHPDYRGGDNSLHVEDLIPKLKERRVKRVEINNHGETTIINGWEKVAAKLLEASFEVSITSNLAKSFSDEEITALANMTVYLSIDAVDPELFRKLRLGARLERVLENVRRIQLRKKELNISKPFGWRTILCDATYPGVLELINLGLQLGVTEFYFGHLQKMMDFKSSFDVSHILALPQKKVDEALCILNKAQKILDGAKVVHDLDKCIEQLKSGTNPQIISYDNPDPEACSPFEAVPKQTFNELLTSNKTRNCLLPWNMFQIKHNQNVTFCCWMKSLGNLKTENLETILNGEKAKLYRKGLLTGELMSECRVCPVRESLPLQYQIQNVRDYLNQKEAPSS
jgi:MoaA/NifB/PqqE/SkfB family radical SAM enzyme